MACKGYHATWAKECPTRKREIAGVEEEKRKFTLVRLSAMVMVWRNRGTEQSGMEENVPMSHHRATTEPPCPTSSVLHSSCCVLEPGSQRLCIPNRSRNSCRRVFHSGLSPGTASSSSIIHLSVVSPSSAMRGGGSGPSRTWVTGDKSGGHGEDERAFTMSGRSA